jgi:hypothetical protein
VLSAETVSGRDGAVAEFEVDTLAVIEVTAEGRIVWRTTFDPEDLDAATAQLHERQRLLGSPR